MSYSISDLPIDRVNRKKGILIFYGIASIICWSITIAIFAANNWNIGHLLKIRNFIMMPGWALIWVYMFIYTYMRHSRLLIDSIGIHVTVNGTTRNYFWPDIGHVRKVVVDHRNGATVAQIVRKGQILTDNKSDLIWGEFGLSVEDLTALVQAGQAKWGTEGAAL